MVKSNDKSLDSGKQTEAGYGVIIVIMLMFFFFVMVFAGVGSSMSSARSQENLLTRQHEKWDAKSGLATLRRVMEVRVPARYREHIAQAKTCLASGGRTESQISAMKPFDEQDTPPSNPVVVVQADGTAVCNTVGGSNFLSFLGNSNAWAQALLPSLEQQARSFGYSTDTIKVARFIEQVRRFNQAGEPTYNLGFIIDARGGQHYRVREEGEVLLGNPSGNCGATGKLEIAPQTVASGSPVTFKITYTSVSRLLVTNRAGTVIKDVVVGELSTPQIYTFDYTPAADDSYRVEATASNSGCFSRSEYVPVAVTVVRPPACPVIDVLNATPGSVQSGETSVVSWSVRNASEVTLDNAVVAGNGSQGFVILADRTFTLTARNSSNTCPATMQVPVKMVATPCAQPTVASFALNPSSVAPGEQVMISWQINNLIAGGRVNITLPDGSVLSDVGASGSRAVAAPGSVGTFNYSINAANPCGTSVTDTKPLQVSKAPCVGPTFASYAANPNSVLAGGSSPIQFNWSLSGTVDTVSIDQGIGAVSGNAYTLSTQPQTTTTYTISAVGCGVRQTASSTVVVNIKPNCSTPAVKISANPNVVAPNGQSILSWSAAGMENGGRITISGPNGFSANVQSPPSPASPSGTLSVTLPGIPGDYIYTATALNPCDGGQMATAQTTIRVSSAPATRQYAETGGSRSGSYTAAQARAEIATNADGRITVEIVVYANGRLDYLEITQNGVLLKRFNNINEYFALGFGGNKFTPNVPFDPNQPITLNMQVTATINAGSLQETSVLNTSSANKSPDNSCTKYNGFSSPNGNFTCGYQGTDLSQIAASGVASY